MNLKRSIDNRRGQGARRRCGYTLIELTLAIGLSLGVSAAIVGVLAQHTAFMSLLGQFNFLRDDAPQINNVMSKLSAQAVSYRLYGSRADAFSNTGAVNSDATAVRLIFRNPNGTFDQAVVAFESVSGDGRLNYYQNSGGWPGQPNWTISSKPAAVSFSDTSGIFEMTLTGPAAEQITFAGTTE